MKRWAVRLILLIGILAAGSASAGQIYIWTDPSGVKHYSDTPPPEGAGAVEVVEKVPYDAEADQRRMEADRQWIENEARRLEELRRQEAAERRAAEAEARRLEAERRKAEQAAREKAEQEKAAALEERRRDHYRPSGIPPAGYNPPGAVPPAGYNPVKRNSGG